MKLLSLATLVAFTTVAHAQSKSWATVKGMLPDNVNVVAGANLGALRGTSIYQSVVPQLLAKEKDLARAFDLAKSTCAIDLHAALVDVTFAVGDDERGVIVLALDKSLDQKRLLDCGSKLVAAQAPAPDAMPPAGGLKGGAKKSTPAPAPKPAAKLVAKTTGKITEIGVDVDPKRFYLAWLAPDVIAVATDADDKPLLEKMLSGKGTKGALSTYLGKASSSAAVWIASTKGQSIQQGVNMRGMYGTIDAARGNISVDMSVVLGDAKEAKNAVDMAKSLITSMRANIPPQFTKLVDAVKLAAIADAANVKLTASEKDVMAVVAMAMMNL